MQKISGFALLAVLTAGCQSTPFNAHQSRFTNPTVSDDVLVNVPQSDRDGITKCRTEWNEMKDRVTIAENNVGQEKQRLNVAEAELDVSEDAVSAAKKGLSVARNSSESTREHEVDNAQEQLEGSQARWRSAKSKIAFTEAHIDQLDSEVDLAKLRVDLAGAKVELAKAQAVSKLDRPHSRDISVSEFQACVEEEASEVAMGEVDAAAWEKKVKLRQDALDKRLAVKSASYDKKN